ncbi:orf126 [Sucra jujuba nucleopolyhedrovirus]|uniref:Orf126 n=1 Tax=Sucra jujuba nucleopolyhedrovirus TaxID=1563660 RepID=A0A097P957_9ABAC|nr:orf126 [Sucra jujuba nucleopolyhedrovirus]AIU41365.1 orf126 [Sucra jujuba nucleopolyhedrovirus]
MDLTKYIQIDSVNDESVKFLDCFSNCFFFQHRRSLSIKMMFLVRVCTMILINASFALSVYAERDKRDYMTYYSHWCIICAIFMCSTNTVVSKKACSKRHFVIINQHEEKTKNLPWHTNLQWILFNISTCNNVLVSLVYLFAIHGAANFEKTQHSNEKYNFITLCAHVLNLAAVLIELVFGTIPVYLKHIYQPLAVTIFYGIFYLAYKTRTGLNIYGCMNTNYDMTLYAGLLLFLNAILYVVTFCVHCIKCKFTR